MAIALTSGIVGFRAGAAGTLSGVQPGEPPGAAASVDLVGPVRVIDGDTLVMNGVRIRLEGIDAPESDQTCGTAPGDARTRAQPVSAKAGQPPATGPSEPWTCGTAATQAMVHLVRGGAVTCRPHGLDKYGRTLATCFVAGRDVNAEMVRTGMAWAYVKYSKAYVRQEAEARAAHAGIWQGEAMPAWDWRHRSWDGAEATAPGGCAIKGNVSRQGRIYHMPWSPWYGKVVMEEAKGTRWFCSETEAVAAGWRPARAW